MVNIQLLKLIDGVIGHLLATLLPSAPQSPVPKIIQSVLIIRPGGIGDAVLLAPVISHLRKTCPAAQITVLAEQRNAGVFDLVPAVDRIFRYDKPGQFIEVLRGRYDIVIDSEQWHRLSAIVARLIRAPIKIGFDTNERRRMFTHTLPYSHDNYEMTSFCRLSGPLNGDLKKSDTISAPFITIPDAAVQTVATLLKPLEGKMFIALFPGASIPERRWGAERFRLVADQLLLDGFMPVVVGGAVDQADGQFIAGEYGINLAGKTSLAETAAILACSSLLISGDSGVLHLAVGLGVATVSLFGPGRALKWSPQGSNHVVINKKLDCSPCTTFGTTPACHFGMRCMKEISVEDVVSAANKLLTRQAASTNPDRNSGY